MFSRRGNSVALATGGYSRLGIAQEEGNRANGLDADASASPHQRQAEMETRRKKISQFSRVSTSFGTAMDGVANLSKASFIPQKSGPNCRVTRRAFDPFGLHRVMLQRCDGLEATGLAGTPQRSQTHQSIEAEPVTHHRLSSATTRDVPFLILIGKTS